METLNSRFGEEFRLTLITNDVQLAATADQAGVNRVGIDLEYLGKSEQYGEGLNGQDGNGGATILYSPQYATGGGYRTALSIVNLESVAGTVTSKSHAPGAVFVYVIVAVCATPSES